MSYLNPAERGVVRLATPLAPPHHDRPDDDARAAPRHRRRRRRCARFRALATVRAKCPPAPGYAETRRQGLIKPIPLTRVMTQGSIPIILHLSADLSTRRPLISTPSLALRRAPSALPSTHPRDSQTHDNRSLRRVPPWLPPYPSARDAVKSPADTRRGGSFDTASRPRREAAAALPGGRMHTAGDALTACAAASRRRAV